MAGKQVLVAETAGGEVVIDCRATFLPARSFVKDGRVTQGAIVENKVLGAALADIQRQQSESGAESAESALVAEGTSDEGVSSREDGTVANRPVALDANVVISAITTRNPDSPPPLRSFEV